MTPLKSLGAEVMAGPTTRFLLFSDHAQQCAVQLFRDHEVVLSSTPMDAIGDGYHELYLEGVGHGALYKLVLDDLALPDPYARYLPHGVHGPAMVIEPRFTFHHPRPAPAAQPIIYELHIGTFTEQGTYAAACLKLPLLRELGVSAIELMPVAAFPGARGWGYDGVALFAPYAPYGTPDELRALVDVAHGLGLSVLLDVVYNHLGPAGNYLPAFSRAYLHDQKSSWGDGPSYACPAMRALVRDNVRYWLEEFRFDGLRMDAVHAIADRSPKHIVCELTEMAHHVYPSALLIAEDDRNDAPLLREQGMNAVWADDFHHQLHVTLTGERDGYYAAYEPGVEALARCIERGFLFEGQGFPPWGKARGKPADGVPASAFVYCLQNHDQVGNRALGERLSASLPVDSYLMASAILLFLPMTPLLFMGQEWAASTPFQYFTDHDPELGAAVAKGRREEFKTFHAFSEEAARAQIPDPQAPETFRRSKLRWAERDTPDHAHVLRTYRALIALRMSDRVLAHGAREALLARAQGELLVLTRTHGDDVRTLVANFAREPRTLPSELPSTALFGNLDAQRSLPAAGFVVLAYTHPSRGQ